MDRLLSSPMLAENYHTAKPQRTSWNAFIKWDLSQHRYIEAAVVMLYDAVWYQTTVTDRRTDWLTCSCNKHETVAEQPQCFVHTSKVMSSSSFYLQKMKLHSLETKVHKFLFRLLLTLTT